MKRVAILTDFINHDPAYSLCSVVANQTKMLAMDGYPTTVIVRPEFEQWVKQQVPVPVGVGATALQTRDNPYGDAEIVAIDPGRTGSNTVEVGDFSGAEIVELTRQLKAALADIDVCLTHDLVFQPNQWKYHIAARRVARELPSLKWLHWVHSNPANFDVLDQVGEFREEIEPPFPNGQLVVMHVEERQRKAAICGYPLHQTVIIPNPIDFTESYHPAALEAIEKGGLWDADCIAVYPCRLDRGKQPHILVEVFAQLIAMGADAQIVFVDFHSVGGDKAEYREDMKAKARVAGVPVLFTSELDYPEANYHIPHKAVMDLLEFGDILIHPSRSESDPLVVPEAAWKRCGLILNYDLPLFHLYEGRALLYKFSSNIDVTTGMPGQTDTNYDDRDGYMRHVAGGIAYLMSKESTLYWHAKMRKTRSLQAVWRRHLWPAIEAS